MNSCYYLLQYNMQLRYIATLDIVSHDEHIVVLMVCQDPVLIYHLFIICVMRAQIIIIFSLASCVCEPVAVVA